MALMNRFAKVWSDKNTDAIHVAVFGSHNELTRTNHTFANLEEVPTWIKERIAILDFCSNVEGVGMKVKAGFGPKGWVYHVEDEKGVADS
jgi:hypothetical protein|tara:strand:- start:65 stop:334 length:270 start_codon:yes stop_codon:yes gene_type:complete